MASSLSEPDVPDGTPLRATPGPPPDANPPQGEPPARSARRVGARLRAAKRHPRLRELEELQKSQPDFALLTLRQAMERLSADENENADPALVFGLASALTSSSVARDELEGVLDPIATAVSRLRTDPSRQDAASRTARQYLRMVEFERLRGDEGEAIKLFGRARRLSPQDDGLVEEMTRAAVALGRSDLETADLYLSYLETRPADAELKESVLERLRTALQVDLVEPSDDRLPSIRKLGSRLLKLVPHAWCAAVQVVCDLREGQFARALELTQRYSADEARDVATWAAFALAAYRNRRWTDARAFLEGARQSSQEGRCGSDSAWAGLLVPLENMLLVNETLYGVSSPDLTKLHEAAESLKSSLPNDAHAVDGRWIVGSALAVLGRDQEAVQAFQIAPAALRTWRFAELELLAYARIRAEDALLGRLEPISSPSQKNGVGPEAAAVAALAAARIHHRKNRDSESRGLLTLAETHLSPGFDPDLALARWCLQTELSLRSPTSTIVEAVPPAANEPVSAPVATWRDRLVARSALARGEFGQVAALRDAPAQTFFPAEERNHLHAVELAFRQQDADETDRAFDAAAFGPAATPEYRLARALWKSSREPASARDTIAEALAESPDSLEARLAAYSLDVTAALEAIDPSEADRFAPLSTPQLDDVAWETAPQTTLFRPWFALLPPDVWGKPIDLSPHRVADMLFASDELLRARRADDAVKLMERLRGRLAKGAEECDKWLAARMREGSLLLLRQGRIRKACDVHRRTPDSDEGDVFPEALARSLLDASHADASALDEALDLWTEWLSRRPAGAAPNGTVARALEKFLHVEERAGVSPADESDWVESRAARCMALAAARPEWDWPRRNLARARRRQGRGHEALELLARLLDPQPDDFRLRGQILWDEGEFFRARDAFRQAAAAAPDDAVILFWKAMAEAATRYGETARTGRWPPPAEFESLLADLQPEAAPAESLDLARLWFGSVLIAAGREDEAIESLMRVEGDATQGHARALVRLAHAQRRNFDEATELDEMSTHEEKALQLWFELRRPGRARRASALQKYEALVRLGIEHPAWALCQAFVAALEGKADRALRVLASSARFETDDPGRIVLRPLGRFLDAERAWLTDHIHLLSGEESPEDLTDLDGPEISRDAARLVAARRHALRRDWNRAVELLNVLVDGDPSHADALGLAAHVALRNGNLEEARRRLAEVRRIEPTHPQVALVDAALIETEADVRDDADAEARHEKARDLYESVWSQPAILAEPRERGHAALALGRLAEAKRRWGEARGWYEKASALDPDWPAPRRRLALILVRTEDDPTSLSEASDLLQEVDGPLHMQAALARGLLAWKRSEPMTAAESIGSLVDSPQLSRLPAPARRALLDWAAALLVRQKMFEPAARVLSLLVAEADPDRLEELEARRDDCRVRSILARLQRGSLTDAVVTQARADSDEIASRRPASMQAAAVGVLCRILVARGELPADLRERIDRLHALDPHRREWKLFVGLIRENWLRGEAADLPEADFAPSDASPQVRQALRLLQANRLRQLQPLLEAADSLRTAEVRSTAERLPFAPHDLARLAALQEIAGGKLDEAMERLTEWSRTSAAQDTVAPNGGVKVVHELLSRLWARRAAAELKQDELEQARESLAQAMRFLTGGDV